MKINIDMMKSNIDQNSIEKIIMGIAAYNQDAESVYGFYSRQSICCRGVSIRQPDLGPSSDHPNPESNKRYSTT